MSRQPSAFRPRIELLESREVPSVTLPALDVPSVDGPLAYQGSGDEGSDSPLSLQSERFVTHLYQDVLGRQPDIGGLTHWVTLLDNGTYTTGQVSIQFVASNEFRTNVVISYYQNILGRIPVPAEVSVYLGLFQAGWSQDDIRGLFLASEEYFNRLNRNSGTFVTQLYTQVLGRSASAGEVSYWVSVLASTNGDRSLVANEFLSSNEFHQIEVNAGYTFLLHRPVDPSGFNYWVGQLNGGVTVETFAVSILASNEYYLRP